MKLPHRFTMLAVFVSVLMWLSAAAGPVAAQADPAAASACECLDTSNPEDKAAVVWRGPSPSLSLPELATLVAPVLWYSVDEPLVVMGDLPLPHAHPCDDPAELGVTYYQVTKIMLRPGADEVTIPEQEDAAFFEKTDQFTVRYYFYYHQDYGMNGHVHDLEVAEFEVSLAETDSGCFEVEILRVTALAHGTDWYSNELQINGEFVRTPIVLFVEEGKHATCPDRNADGIYTPGYDVNVRINDAWGVRDVFGAGWLIAPGYTASMTKPRHLRFRVLPPDSPNRCDVDVFSSSLRDTTDLDHYELRAANTVVMCEDVPPDREFLIEMMTKHHFGGGNEPEQLKSGSVKKLADPLLGSGRLPSINLRWDRGLGVSFAAQGLPIEAIYLVPRATWIFDTGEVSAEGLISTSASRFMGSYLSAGAAYEYDRWRNSSGGIEKATDKRWNFVAETGVKFRFRISGKLRFATLGYQFAGVRFGIRVSGFDSFKNGRFIAEIGGGVW